MVEEEEVVEYKSIKVTLETYVKLKELRRRLGMRTMNDVILYLLEKEDVFQMMKEWAKARGGSRGEDGT